MNIKTIASKLNKLEKEGKVPVSIVLNCYDFEHIRQEKESSYFLSIEDEKCTILGVPTFPTLYIPKSESIVNWEHDVNLEVENEK